MSKKETKRNINIYDIAEETGVSIATVSRVLNGSGKVKKETQDKILRVMEQQGYSPNIFARGLGLNSIKMVGLLCTDIADLYYAKAISVVERQLKLQGYDTLLCCTGNSLDEKEKNIKLLLEKRVDAMIAIGSAFKERSDNHHLELAARQVPMMIVNGVIDLENVYCIICDEKKATRDCVARFVEKGHNDIAFLYDVETDSSMRKIRGYKEGLGNCGISPEKELIVRTESGIDGGKRAMISLLESGREFSGIMTSNDLLAVGAMKAMEQIGASLPIVGFDNSILAQATTPGLTSIDNKVEELCIETVRVLNEVFLGRAVSQKIVLEPEFIKRETF